MTQFLGPSGVPSSKSRLLTRLMGNMELLCKQFKGIGPHLAEGEVSWYFSSCGGNLGIFSSYGGDGHSKLMFVQGHQVSCIVTRDTSGISSRLATAIRMLLIVRWETECAFLFATVILGFLSIFKKGQTASSFEAFHSACFSWCQRDVRPRVQMMLVARAFSRVSTGDSDIPSSCEMKDEPAFKALQGNLSFFPVRASRCPFHLRQQTPCPSHIPIA